MAIISISSIRMIDSGLNQVLPVINYNYNLTMQTLLFPIFNCKLLSNDRAYSTPNTAFISVRSVSCGRFNIRYINHIFRPSDTATLKYNN